MKIRILGLNDDNHQTVFINEAQIGNFYTGNQLINMLAKPHTNEFEVKTAYLINLETEEESFAFELLEEASYRNIIAISYEEYQKLFNILWEVAQ